MKFKPEFIERVQEANNLVDIISQYSQLRPVGGGFMGRCPFPDHPEKTPSFSVSEVKQVYNCFGCHKKGNIFTFLGAYNGMNFPEAVEYLAARAQIPLPVHSVEESKFQDQALYRKKEIIGLNRFAAGFFYDHLRQLPADHVARKYLEKRGLQQETLDLFRVGFATAGWDDLVQRFSTQGMNLALAQEAKLIKARKDGKTGYFDIFRERIIFPIQNLLGETLGFGGRILLSGEPKYLNSPETVVFNKGKILYGLDQTARFIRSEDQAIIVEGYMDLVSLFQAGIKNVAATMGTALTPDHGKLMSRMTKNIVVLFDGDDAGQQAAERSLPILLSAGLFAKGLVLPDGNDPDDYVRKHGAGALSREIVGAPDLFSIVLARWMQGYRGEASQKIQLCDRLARLFSSVEDARLRQLYGVEAANKMGVSAQWLSQALAASPDNAKQQVYKNIENKSNPPEPIETKDPDPEDSVIRLKGLTQPERMMVELIFKRSKYFTKFESDGLQEFIQHSGFRELYKKAFSVYGQHPEKFDKLTGLLVSFVDHPEWIIGETSKKGSLELANDDGTADDKLFQDCVKRIKENFFKETAEALSQELKVSPTPEKWEKFMKIQRDRLALSKDNT